MVPPRDQSPVAENEKPSRTPGAILGSTLGPVVQIRCGAVLAQIAHVTCTSCSQELLTHELDVGHG
jgi:hypothetical protein